MLYWECFIYLLLSFHLVILMLTPLSLCFWSSCFFCYFLLYLLWLFLPLIVSSYLLFPLFSATNMVWLYWCICFLCCDKLFYYCNFSIILFQLLFYFSAVLFLLFMICFSICIFNWSITSVFVILMCYSFAFVSTISTATIVSVFWYLYNFL